MSRINIDELSPGDKLIEVRCPRFTTAYSLHEWEVARILKSRVVVTNKHGGEHRLLVRDGHLTGGVEGEGVWGRGVRMYLPTAPELPEYRLLARREGLTAAVAVAAQKLDRSRDSIEKGEALRDALTAWLDFEHENKEATDA